MGEADGKRELGETALKGRPNFRTKEHARQAAYIEEFLPGLGGHEGRPVVLLPKHQARNLFDGAPPLTAGIVWHKYLAHGASSQACCLNFLWPLATHPQQIAAIVELATGRKPLQMSPANSETDDLVDFEFVGRSNYLNEWGPRGPTRGANLTSADAIVRFRSEIGEEALLIEWKYTENDQGRIPNKQPTMPKEGRLYGDDTRRRRYGERFFGDDSPFRAELNLSLDDFFYKPFYQLLRQQLLATAMEADGLEPARRVTVLHIAPSANQAVRKISAPRFKELAVQFGKNSAYEVFRSCLKHQDRFLSLSTEAVFNPLLDHRDAPVGWRDYLRTRYKFLREEITDTDPA